MDIPAFRAAIRAKRSELAADYPDGCLYVTSLNNRLYNTTAGKVCEVTVDNAARLLTQETHRIATESEIAAFKAAAESRRLANEAAEVAKLPSNFRVTLRGGLR